MAKTPGQLDRDIAESLTISVTEDALEAFWKVVARRYPQAKTGDLSPGSHYTLQRAAQDAVAEWVEANVGAGGRSHATKKPKKAPDLGTRHADRGDRVLADLASWGIDRAQVDEVRTAFRSGENRRAMALARDLGWNRASKRGRAFR